MGRCKYEAESWGSILQSLRIMVVFLGLMRRLKFFEHLGGYVRQCVKCFYVLCIILIILWSRYFYYSSLPVKKGRLSKGSLAENGRINSIDIMCLADQFVNVLHALFCLISPLRVRQLTYHYSHFTDKHIIEKLSWAVIHQVVGTSYMLRYCFRQWGHSNGDNRSKFLSSGSCFLVGMNNIEHLNK